MILPSAHRTFCFYLTRPRCYYAPYLVILLTNNVNTMPDGSQWSRARIQFA